MQKGFIGIITKCGYKYLWVLASNTPNEILYKFKRSKRGWKLKRNEVIGMPAKLVKNGTVIYISPK